MIEAVKVASTMVATQMRSPEGKTGERRREREETRVREREREIDEQEAAQVALIRAIWHAHPAESSRAIRGQNCESVVVTGCE